MTQSFGMLEDNRDVVMEIFLAFEMFGHSGLLTRCKRVPGASVGSGCPKAVALREPLDEAVRFWTACYDSSVSMTRGGSAVFFVYLPVPITYETTRPCPMR